MSSEFGSDQTPTLSHWPGQQMVAWMVLVGLFSGNLLIATPQPFSQLLRLPLPPDFSKSHPLEPRLKPPLHKLALQSETSELSIWIRVTTLIQLICSSMGRNWPKIQLPMQLQARTPQVCRWLLNFPKKAVLAYTYQEMIKFAWKAEWKFLDVWQRGGSCLHPKPQEKHFKLYTRRGQGANNSWQGYIQFFRTALTTPWSIRSLLQPWAAPLLLPTPLQPQVAHQEH